MTWFEAILLGIVEGVTEFLQVSSTAHLTIVENLLGYSIDDPGVTAFTAIIQSGAVLAVVLYFRRDILRIVIAWIGGIADRDRWDRQDYQMGWIVILGSTPIALVGLVFRESIETKLRNLWLIGAAMILWSAVMWLADRATAQTRSDSDLDWRDALVVGGAQCLALVPGVSRSGASISAGLFRDLDRVSATRLSFLLSIPSLLAAAALQTVTRYGEIGGGVGWGPTLTATLVSFVVAYVAVAWLLRFVSGHSFTVFIVYRLIVGVTVLALVVTETTPAT